MELHVFRVEVLHQLMLRRQRPDQLAHAVPEIERLEQQQLDDEETDLQRRKLTSASKTVFHFGFFFCKTNFLHFVVSTKN
jgi:hypothetical protein